MSAGNGTTRGTTGPTKVGPVFEGLARGVAILAGATLVALVGLVIAEVVARGLFNTSLAVVEEFVGYFVVLLMVLGAALALRGKDLFRISFLADALPSAVERGMRVLFILIALSVCCVFAWRTGDLVVSSFSRGKISQTVLETPLWIPQLALPVGFCILALFLVEHLLVGLGVSKEGND
ncbi:MAG: TRAP transporter small permease subunit [Rhodospirillum sp.]|nr:TRAP transporter small permease subunit [Rhodospirillum sp.]MCF8491301.1 TRAP transporter small permease subunit [Rhodospirillum sp.]MCF8502181.1 TRAP transporter small permease subunit [Rhodospirillum sp.]